MKPTTLLVAHNQVTGLQTVQVEQVQLPLKLKTAAEHLTITAPPTSTHVTQNTHATSWNRSRAQLLTCQPAALRLSYLLNSPLVLLLHLLLLPHRSTRRGRLLILHLATAWQHVAFATLPPSPTTAGLLQDLAKRAQASSQQHHIPLPVLLQTSQGQTPQNWALQFNPSPRPARSAMLLLSLERHHAASHLLMGDTPVRSSSMTREPRAASATQAHLLTHTELVTAVSVALARTSASPSKKGRARRSQTSQSRIVSARTSPQFRSSPKLTTTSLSSTRSTPTPLLVSHPTLSHPDSQWSAL